MIYQGEFIGIIVNQMRRKYNKQNSTKEVRRNNSHPNFVFSQNRTLAELNLSTKNRPQVYHPLHPVRVHLPEYFNIPKFQDKDILNKSCSEQELIKKMRSEIEVRRKLKDLQILAQGMRRAKNIKEESRYYFSQAVFLHNSQMYQACILALEKFLKIVLFIKDEKSVELALNAIGVEYMYLDDCKKAMQYHRKQGEMGQADTFLSKVNCGLCYEIGKDPESALKEYQETEQLVKVIGDQQRKSLIKKLIERAQKWKNAVFITKEQSINNSINMTEIQPPITKRRAVRKSVEKIEKAIETAEGYMDEFLQSMKNSFLAERE